MSQFEQKDNTGALFQANNMRVLRQGNAMVNGDECDLIVTESKTKDGRVLYDTYVKIGGFFPNKYKQEGDSKPDVSSTVVVHGESMKMAGWKNVSKNGMAYIKLSFQPNDGNAKAKSNPQELSAVGQAAQDDVPDENIPF